MYKYNKSVNVIFVRREKWISQISVSKNKGANFQIMKENRKAGKKLIYIVWTS